MFYAGREHMTDTTKNFPLTLFKPGLSLQVQEKYRACPNRPDNINYFERTQIHFSSEIFTAVITVVV